MIPPGAAFTGLRAALAAPRWIATRGLDELLEPAQTPARPVTDATAALRVSRFALRVLAHLHPLHGPWENDCLHRSVAACLVLRRHGLPAVLKLGARTAAAAPTAHAWVEDPAGRVLIDDPMGHTAFRPIDS